MGGIKKICRALFVLPFTAGSLRRWNRNGISKHDGSISGFILTTSLVAMVTEVVYICNSFQEKHPTAPSISKFIQITLNCLGITSYIIIGIKEQPKIRNTSKRHGNDENRSLKLKFVCLFCLGCVIYRLLKIILHIKCKVYTRENDSVGLALSYDFCAIFFYLLQTGCIHYFSRNHQFVRSLSTFYCLIAIVVTNISSWTYHSTRKHDYSQISIYSSDSNITDGCSHNGSTSVIKEVFGNARPFIEPMLLEYPLLCLLLVAEMWPDKFGREEINNIESLQERWPNKTERQEQATYTEINPDCEMIPLTGNRKTHIVCHDTSNPRKMYLIFAFAAVFSTPRVIIDLLHILGTLEANYFFVSVIITTLEQLLLLVVLCGCFHALSSQCQPLNEVTTYNIRNLVLIVSSLVTTAYLTLQCVSHILLSRNYQILSIFNDIIQMIVIYFQTVFILQMTKYKIMYWEKKYFSLSYLCLFVGFMSLGYWLSDTFIVVQFIYKFRDSISLSSTSLDIFWFPFVIFYKFECFMCFYSLYKMPRSKTYPKLGDESFELCDSSYT